MSKDNPYRSMIARHAALLDEGAALPLGGLTPRHRRPPPAVDAPRVLMFSPHPDDECIIGGLPLRLMRQCQMRVINVAMTLGRHPERRAARRRELEGACAYIGFELLHLAENGLETVDIAVRERRSDVWSAAVTAVAGTIAAERPEIVVMPHDDDWHPAHVGTHHLVIDALDSLPRHVSCHVIETEFWRAMAAPNLMVESGRDDVAELAAALSFHVGEVARNPYHLRLPAWMIDNVRRGSELVLERGGEAPDIAFATLYRLRRWADGGLREVSPAERVLSAADDPGCLFA